MTFKLGPIASGACVKMVVATVQGKRNDAGVMLALKPLGSTLGLGRVHDVAISALALTRTKLAQRRDTAALEKKAMLALKTCGATLGLGHSCPGH